MMQRKQDAHAWWECKLVQPLRKTWRFPTKLKTELPRDPTINLWVLLKENKNTII